MSKWFLNAAAQNGTWSVHRFRLDYLYHSKNHVQAAKLAEALLQLNLFSEYDKELYDVLTRAHYQLQDYETAGRYADKLVRAFAHQSPCPR